MDVLVTPAPDVRDAALIDLLEREWDCRETTLVPVASERDRMVLTAGHVLTVVNPAQDPAELDLEAAALRHLRAVAPDLPLPSPVPTRTGPPFAFLVDDRGRRCAAWLQTRLPGSPLQGTPLSESMIEQIGNRCARVSDALSGFFHPAAGRRMAWDIRDLDDRPVPGEELLRVAWDRAVPAVRAARTLPGGVQHADLTLTNLLAVGDDITGVIDLGDLHHTAAVCDLAVCLTSILRNAVPNQVGTGPAVAAFLRGYLRVHPLCRSEIEVLDGLVTARLVLKLLISAERADAHPENRSYIRQYDAATRQVLASWLSTPAADVTARLHRLAGTAHATADPRPLLDRRNAVMAGPLSPLFYRTPLHLVRGAGSYLFDAHGRRYLDGYNNVAVVGHAHPAVAAAVHSQMVRFNSHSRYLHDEPVRLAERLLATMPDGLDTCLFTNSGSESNELAYRLAAAWTGRSGAITSEHAYHGISSRMSDLSSSEWPPGHRPPDVGLLRAPHAGEAELTRAEGISRVERAVAPDGSEPALVVADSQFTSEGVLDYPAAFLAGLIDGTHRRGALFVADEVQSGFGRCGPALWRFALSSVVPDIVTLGKPMGAGYPIGAVITRREIADRLGERYEYFSTFAGMPAAAAAGNAVLDVLAAEEIPDRTVATGALLRARIAALGHPRLGAVRGTGLIAGVDVLAPDGRRFTRTLVDALAQAGVLVGATGPGGTVLKVRPPLVWGVPQVDEFVAALRRVLAQLD